MANNTMPEWIYVKPYKQDGCYRLCSDDQTERGDVEYVRADLVQGDANEQIEDGQLRWVKSSQGGKWIVGAITNYGEGNDFFCNSDRFDGDMPIEDYFKIGPVIRLPEDVL